MVRCVISGGLLAILLARLDWEAASQHIRHLGFLAAAMLVVALGIGLVLRAWKWQWSLRVHGIDLSLRIVTRLLFISFFLNNFLPTSIGGDAYRIYRTTPVDPPRSRGLSAVVLDRVVGFASLLLLGLACGGLLYWQYRLARIYTLIMIGCAALGAAAYALARLYRARRGDPRWLRSRWTAPIHENLAWMRRSHGAWAPLIAIALLYQAEAIVVLWALFAALGAPIGVAQAGLITAAAGVATVFPFSINGLGIVEASTAGAALAVGASYESGLLAALLLRVLVLPFTLIAGLLYAFEPARGAIPSPLPGDNAGQTISNTLSDPGRNDPVPPQGRNTM